MAPYGTQCERVSGGVLEGHTHPKKLKTLESLAGYDGDELHFTQKCNLWGRQPRWEGQCHVATRCLAP